jgi:hypothetical protein
MSDLGRHAKQAVTMRALLLVGAGFLLLVPFLAPPQLEERPNREAIIGTQLFDLGAAGAARRLSE